MAAAFATPEQLAARLGRAVWPPASVELVRVQELLGDASAHLRSVIGWQVSPPANVTTRVPYGTTSLRLPGAPVTAVVSVVLDGVAVPASSYTLEEGYLDGVPSGAVVTYTVGYATAPRDLVSWTCVLVSQALSALEDLGALGGGGVSSIAIDDFRKAWAEGGDGAGFVLPARVEDKLRAAYGSGGAFVTGEA